MNLDEFKDFIQEIGFHQVWRTHKTYFSFITDNTNSSINSLKINTQLSIHIDEVNMSFQLSLDDFSSSITTAKSFGQFSLKTFGQDGFQLELFLSFVKNSFIKAPESIIQYIRNKKITDLTNNI